MTKSLRTKLVFIMALLIVMLMTVVLVLLVRGVQEFFMDQFYDQMESMLGQTELVHQLNDAAMRDDPVTQIYNHMSILSGRLGVDGETRNFYILDGTTAEVLRTTNPNRPARVNITPNILQAMTGRNAYRDGSPRASYMDVALAVGADDDEGPRFLIYILDNKQTVQVLNAAIFTRIFNAVLIGFVISIAISVIISRTLLAPIKGMTEAAEAMADGDFSRKIPVESEDEIGILSTTFNDMATQIETMLEELRKAEQLRREFVANVSHELRTPLTSIRTYAETIYDTEDIPKDMQEEFLRVIINESDRMTKIVQDLLLLSRFDSGNSNLQLEKFSIERSVRDIYAAIALEAKKRNHQLNMELEWKLPRIQGDKARIEQVLMNIIINAVKYTPDGGVISIYSGSADGKVWIRIEDTGVGIPQEDLLRVFERFYRVDKARARESGGTGLGLAIAHEIIKMHGGDIQIESTPGSGTSVLVTLPIEGPDNE